ncbi:MAG: hypothetical protein ABI868_04305 [Acidobacteriota bacterium]
MPTTETRRTAETLDATTLLDHIEQVAHWVSPQDPGRKALLSGVIEMKQRLAGQPLSRGDVLNFQVNVWRLKGHRFKTLLVRRAAQLGKLYGLASD